MRKMDIVKMARMIMLRGVGYRQATIAEELGVSTTTIGYQLKILRKLAEEHDPKDIFEYYIKGLNLKGD